MADDFGYECVTANGGESYQTPSLDRLAAGGLRFEQCHVQPLCTPTRVQLMTGRYNIRNYVGFGTLLRSEKTFAHLFKEGGYATAVCGKWQLGHEVDSPKHFGFDEACLWQHTRRPPRYANPGLEINGVEKDFSNGEYGPKLVNDFALDFITKHKDQPFFLYYPMLLTHAPFQPTPDSPGWDPKAVGENKNDGKKNFADNVAYMDKMIGRLDAKLSELGIRDNTLLVFLGDNGTGGGVVSRFKGADYKGGKGATTCRGTHVPLIASWPAVMKQGRVSRDLISGADILPTLCGAAGLPVPEIVDGVSFLAQIKGEKGTPREWIYTWYSPMHGSNSTTKEWALDSVYKLYGDGKFFDLSKDPYEEKPLVKNALDTVAAAAERKLAGVIEKFKDARPVELDRTKSPQASLARDAAEKTSRPQDNKGALKPAKKNRKAKTSND
jgi:arylsulfatase A